MLEEMEGTEFFELAPEKKLRVLTGLLCRVLATYSVELLQEELQNESTLAW